MSGRVEGKIALISGAGSGLGKATAIHLAREGARIVATDIDGDTAEATAASINGEFQGAALAAVHDVTKPDQWTQAVDLAGGRVVLEASGNMRLDRVAEVAATGVDYISSGALTHSARTLDLGLDF